MANRALLLPLGLVVALTGCGPGTTTPDVVDVTAPPDSTRPGPDAMTPPDATNPPPDVTAPPDVTTPGPDAVAMDVPTPVDTGSDTGGMMERTAVAMIMPTGEDMSRITGTVTFTQRGTSVEVVYNITNCPNGMHETHIHAGDGCGSRAAQGMHWGPTRGEGIPNLVCTGGTGTLRYTRTAMDPTTAWSIGAPAMSNVLGHPVVIHGAGDTNQRIGCGVVSMR